MDIAAAGSTDAEGPERIGRYEVIRRMAVGGMAEIFLARATGIEGFEKRVVVKRILPHLADSPEFVSMFLDEARLAATLHHANIAQVYDIGIDGDSYFFAMEYIEGKDVRHVRKRLRRRGESLPLPHALHIALGVAAGLHAAHERRGHDGRPLHIVHRDVSPSNVLVTFDGGVKLIDFGIAKAAQRTTHTRTGVLKGKSAYMSPEQWLGEPVDRRSDVFALGILLYELTVGHRLFKKGAEYEVMRAFVKGRSPLAHAFPDGYPAQLERIVRRALARFPEERYPTAAAMHADLERFAYDERLHVSPFALGEFLQRLFPDEGPMADGARPQSVLAPDSGPVIQRRRPISPAPEPRAHTLRGTGEVSSAELTCGEFEIVEGTEFRALSPFDMSADDVALGPVHVADGGDWSALEQPAGEITTPARPGSESSTMATLPRTRVDVPATRVGPQPEPDGVPATRVGPRPETHDVPAPRVLAARPPSRARRVAVALVAAAAIAGGWWTLDQVARRRAAAPVARPDATAPAGDATARTGAPEPPAAAFAARPRRSALPAPGATAPAEQAAAGGAAEGHATARAAEVHATATRSRRPRPHRRRAAVPRKRTGTAPASVPAVADVPNRDRAAAEATSPAARLAGVRAASARAAEATA
ncbi:MAG: serine/threonine protein kinase, partial [Deltaproteobacteria bacterium]